MAKSPSFLFLEIEAASLIAGTVPTKFILGNFWRKLSKALTEMVLQARTITAG